jgi:hypothetical protein
METRTALRERAAFELAEKLVKHQPHRDSWKSTHRPHF